MAKYSYTKDVPNLDVNQLTYEIGQDATITTELDYIVFAQPTVDIYFNGTLSGAEETALAAVVAASPNTNTPFPKGDVVEGILVGDISGLRLKPDNDNPTYQTRIMKGACRDESSLYTIKLSDTITIDITDSGANGLDTGSEASDTWYAVYLIGDTRGINSTAGLYSTSEDDPTLPNGYNVFRRIGWVRNNASSDFLEFRQTVGSYSRRYYYSESSTSTLEVLDNGSATSWTEVDMSSLVPPTAYHTQLLVRFRTGASGSAGNDVGLRTKGESNQNIQIGPGVVNDSKMKIPIEMATNNAQKIEYKVDNSNNDADIAVLGYDDEV
jgi:hypothetical protein